MLEAVRYQAENFDETPAVIAACYARPSVPRDPRLVAGLIRDTGISFMRRLASPRMAVPVGWPAGRFGPVRRRPVADVVHWDRW